MEVLRENYFTEGRSGGATYFVFDSRETVPPKLRRLIQSLDDGPSWVGADGFLGFGVEERDKEERDIVFPGDATEGRQVDFGYYVTVPIGSIRDEEFPRVGGVVDIPATSPRCASVGLGRLALKGMAYKMTLQNPNPSPLTALRNFSFDCKRLRLDLSEPQINLPCTFPGALHRLCGYQYSVREQGRTGMMRPHTVDACGPAQKARS